MGRRTVRIAVAAGCLAGIGTSGWAQSRLHETQFFGTSDGIALDGFGDSMAFDGNFAVFGTEGEDDRGSNAGAAYVFQRIAGVWTQVQKLLASDGGASDNFGHSVDLQGDVIVVGAHADSDLGFARGSAYVFRYDGATWVEEQKLIASDAADADQFGSSVAVFGDRILVGAAHRDHAPDKDVGAVYFFEYDGAAWQEIQHFEASDRAATDFFGDALDLRGDRALVGAFGESDPGLNDRGSAYVFDFDGVQFQQSKKLAASDASSSALFGSSVSLSDDVLVIGAPQADLAGNNSGAAYVFRYDGVQWTEEQKLVGSDTADSDFLAHSVALDGDLLVAGATNDDEAGTNAGAAYAFRFVGTHWVEEAKLVGSHIDNGDASGRCVAIQGGRALVGAPAGAPPGGVVDVFEIEGLALDVQPDVLSPGDPLTLWIGGGVPGTPALLFLTAFDGVPIVLKLLQLPFDPEGRVQIPGNLPNSVPLGSTLDLLVFGIDHEGKIVKSNGERITVQ